FLPPERDYSLEYREPGAGDEDAEGREQRPEVTLLAVPERMLGIGGPRASVYRRQQERLVERVRSRVGGLGEHRARADEEPGHQLDDTDEYVGGARDDDRAAGGPVPRCGRRFSRPGLRPRLGLRLARFRLPAFQRSGVPRPGLPLLAAHVAARSRVPAGCCWRASRRSRCGTTVYFGSRAEARPAWKIPHRVAAEAAISEAPPSALIARPRRPPARPSSAPAAPSTDSAWP